MRLRLILVAVVALSGCTSFNAHDIIKQRGVVVGERTHITIKHRGVWVTYPAPTREYNSGNHLPTKCRPYYNDGTDQWKECMGVGLK